MKTIHTTSTIEATPIQIWDQLVDFESHQHWNPFFASIEGDAVVGSSLIVTARGKGDDHTGMTFKPTVLVAEEGSELRWDGKLAFGGLFDGQHFFVLTANDDGTTTLEHGEDFRGILIPFMGKILRETEEGFVAFNEALKQRVEASNQQNDSTRV